MVDKVVLKTTFKAICPISRTIDNYTLEIEYRPKDGVYIELSSLREYLNKFEDIEVFHEELAHIIAEDLFQVINPKYIKVKLISIYMGINVEVTIEKKL